MKYLSLLAAGFLSMTSLAVSPPLFTADDPLGINVDDVAVLNTMPEQALLRIGFLDVTQPPFSADPTGKKDSTKAINEAVLFGRHHKLAVWFPMGTYTVSDTISCAGGWSDERTPNHKFLPFSEMWPCVLMGERRGAERPVIVLAPNSMGFNEMKKPKPVLDFFGRYWNRKTKVGPLRRDGATNYRQLLYGMDVAISPGNPGAAAVSFDAAEGSTLQDCTFDVGEGCTGILGGPGSGGAVFNLTIRGGSVGALLNSARPTCTLVACRFSGQRDAAVEYRQRGPLTLVGCEFDMTGSAVALRLLNRSKGSGSMVDCRIDYSDPGACAIDARTALYLRNTWVRNVKNLLVSDQAGEVAIESPADWTCVGELAAPYVYENGPHSSVFVDGVKREGILKDLRAAGSPPADLRTRHIWDVDTFPAWNSPGIVNVKDAPYFAKGDGETDDYAALQRAINEHETLFLPKGAYRITKTLQLKPRTKIIGISPSYSMIVPVTVAGGSFGDRKNPQPALRTADTAASETVLAFFSVFMPREDVQAASMLDWACGGKSILRCVFPVTGYTVTEIFPLAKGIRPWNNWTWGQMNDFSLTLGGVAHFIGTNWLYGENQPAEKLEALRKAAATAVPDWPLIRVHGHGAGGFYPFYALDGRPHGSNSRRILVENTQGPFRIYHALLQYSCGLSEMEISNASNVAVYGTKNEGASVVLRVLDSE
ncbi:MAG: glycosyl hydrolase family 28-related protein, partial [Verrucomicrobiota bacterium]|nr:glycosyl hydrolase family 28-related protein [Verrucomicrobiota bacterium]